MLNPNILYSVDLEVWSKIAKRARIKRIALKFARDFECDLKHVAAFSHCVTLTHVLLPQIISYSDTKSVCSCCYECKRASVIYVYELIFLLHTSRSTEYSIGEGENYIWGKGERSKTVSYMHPVQ